MKLRFVILVIVLIIPLFLISEENVPYVPFNQLLQGDFENQHVKTKGFIYYDDKTNQWFLASEPNIKTCCFASKDKIILDGSFKEFPLSQTVELEGVFSVIENEGHPKAIYQLKHVRVEEKGNNLLIPIGILVLSLVLLYQIFKLRKHGETTNDRNDTNDTNDRNDTNDKNDSAH